MSVGYRRLKLLEIYKFTHPANHSGEYRSIRSRRVHHFHGLVSLSGSPSTETYPKLLPLDSRLAYVARWFGVCPMEQTHVAQPLERAKCERGDIGLTIP